MKYSFCLIAFLLLIGCSEIRNIYYKLILPQEIKRFDCENLPSLTMVTDSRRFIAHAGGGIDNLRYTNSLEAVELSIKNGFRLIELDLIITSDNYIVAAHDWSHWQKITGSAISIPTKDEFLDHNLHGKYTPLDSDRIIEIFKSNPGLFLVTDKIKNYKKLLLELPFSNRMIVEVFSIADYISSLQEGILYPALSVEESGGDQAVKFIIENKIPLVVLHADNVRKWKEELEKARKQGTCIFAFTSNEEDFLLNNFDNPIFGVYSDFWNVTRGGCEGDSCDTY